MNLVIANMAVNFSQHAPVRMPHNGGDGQVVMSLDKPNRSNCSLKEDL